MFINYRVRFTFNAARHIIAPVFPNGSFLFISIKYVSLPVVIKQVERGGDRGKGSANLHEYSLIGVRIRVDWRKSADRFRVIKRAIVLFKHYRPKYVHWRSEFAWL